MIFQITDKVRLKGVSREWQLQKFHTVVKKNGESYSEWQSFQYYTSIAHALKACAEYDFRMSDDVADLIARIKNLERVAREAEAMLVKAAEGVSANDL